MLRELSNMVTKDHLPVLAFFNAISNDSFIRVLEHLSKEIGYGINDVDCTFPNDLETDLFDGVMFALHDEEIIISHAEFYHYLRLASKNYIEEYPNDESKVTIILEIEKKKYSSLS